MKPTVTISRRIEGQLTADFSDSPNPQTFPDDTLESLIDWMRSGHFDCELKVEVSA